MPKKTPLSQEQFNELVYWALYTYQSCNLSLPTRFPIGLNQLANSSAPEISRSLFRARMQSLEQQTLPHRLYERLKHHAEVWSHLVHRIQTISSTAQTEGRYETIQNYMSVFAESIAHTEALEVTKSHNKQKNDDSTPYPDIDIPLIYWHIGTTSYSLDDPRYLKKYLAYKQEMIVLINRYFNSHYDYTYLGDQRPSILSHIIELYAPEILATYTITLAAYALSPTSLIARLAVLELPSWLLGADISYAVLWQLTQHTLPEARLSQYIFTPHDHVKIWLSRSADEFLNQENQLRLIHMRTTNPDDVIHFVYAQSLLNANAIEQMNQFCLRYHIKPICIEHDIIPHCKTVNEKKLLDIYQLEITSLDYGGNLAVASDVLRWVSPIYQLGTYSDFDVAVNTKDLPIQMVVQSPLIMPIGSYSVNSHEILCLNNDAISIADGPAARPYIETIQSAIITAYTSRETFQTIYNKQLKDLKIGLGAYSVNPIDVLAIQCLAFLQKTKEPTSIIELRQTIKDLFSTHAKMLTFFENMQKECGDEDELHIIDTTFRDIKASDRNKKNLNHFRRVFSEKLIMLSVIHTTGPAAILKALFPSVTMTQEQIEHDVARFSYFSNASLSKAWKEKGLVCGFYQDVSHILQITQSSHEQDASWLSSGQAQGIIRKIHMDVMAKKIQKAYRDRFFSDEKREDSSDTKNIRAPKKGN